MNKRIVALVAAASLLTACGGGSGDSGESGEIAGDITVLTNRTDLVDTVFQDYKKAFETKYPDVDVEFEAVTDYEGEVTVRMSTEDYGDVLLIPNSVVPSDLPDFFEPLGSVEDLAKTYRFVRSEAAYEGKSYGIAITGNAQGIVYNKAVWAQAGVTTPPTTPAQFIDALKAVDQKTDAVPLYTNYSDGWPLTQWENNRGSISGDPEAVNELAENDAPWAEGQEHHVLDSLLFDAVANKLTEPDPLTTNWEKSKTDLAQGKISSMVLGSWAISQIQEEADKPEDIGYLPFPAQAEGKFHSTIGGDYKNGINVNSENKAAARAWVDWFTEESGYAIDQGGISPKLNDPMPQTLKDFEPLGVEYIELAPAPAGRESLVSDIDREAEIGLLSSDYRQRIVDGARGASGETKEAIFEDLNTRWAKARATQS